MFRAAPRNEDFFRHFIYNTTFPLPPSYLRDRRSVVPSRGPSIHQPIRPSFWVLSLSPTAKLWGSPRLLLLLRGDLGGGIESKEVISSSS